MRARAAAAWAAAGVIIGCAGCSSANGPSIAGKGAVVGHIPAGQFPREMALEPDGQRLLVTNYASGQVEAVSITTLP